MVCWKNLYLWFWRLGLCFENIIIFVLVRFTSKAQVWENWCRRWRWCCSPSLAGDISTGSSENSRHFTSVSACQMPLQTVLRPSPVHWGLESSCVLVWTPQVWARKSVYFFCQSSQCTCLCTLSLWCHRFFHQHHFLTVYTTDSCSKLNQSLFLKSTKQEKNLLFFFVYLVVN